MGSGNIVSIFGSIEGHGKMSMDNVEKADENHQVILLLGSNT